MGCKTGSAQGESGATAHDPMHCAQSCRLQGGSIPRRGCAGWHGAGGRRNTLSPWRSEGSGRCSAVLWDDGTGVGDGMLGVQGQRGAQEMS